MKSVANRRAACLMHSARSVGGYLEKGIHIPMAQGRSTKTISMIKWIWTSGLSIKNSLSLEGFGLTACASSPGMPAGLYREVQFSIEEQPLGRIVKRFRGGLVFKAPRWLYPSTLGPRGSRRVDRLRVLPGDARGACQDVCRERWYGDGLAFGVQGLDMETA